MSQHRREFIRNTSLLLLGSSLPLEMIAKFRHSVAPSDRIRVGVIGLRGQGWANLVSMLKLSEVQCVAICDIDQEVIRKRKQELETLKQSPVIFTDHRNMLEMMDLDVVIVATPDHWHCLQMIDAVESGRDVFVEKPVANSIYETNLMIAAAEKSKRIVQVAQWQRSMQHFKDAISFVHSGKLGRVHSTKAWMYRGNTKGLPVVANSEVPAGVDYKQWLGPAPMRPFNANRFHYEFRWFWDYAGGLMTDWGVHLIDMVLAGMKANLPVSVIASGGKLAFPDDARETPDIFLAQYDFGNFQMTWEHNMATGQGLYGMQHGIAFIGENGTLLLNRGGWEVRPDRQGDALKMEGVSWQKQVDNGLDLHTKNFIESVRSRNPGLLNCDIKEGGRAAIVSHMGNIAYRTGEKINIQNHVHFFKESAANKLVKPEYKNGWKLGKL